MIAVIDYGVGNLFSLCCSLDFLKIDYVVTKDREVIEKADKIIFPGVGAFGDAIKKLEEENLVDVLKNESQKGKPIFGICLGMQLLFEESDEFGLHKGLGLLKGKITDMKVAFGKEGYNYKVPQIGWNSLDFHKKNPLCKYIKEGDYVYYVHSFYGVDCDESLVASSNYGVTVPGIVSKDNLYGCQFHPEKSGEVGLNILKAFAEL